MKIDLEADDIQHIADSVMHKLTPMLLQLQETLQQQSLRQAAMTPIMSTTGASSMIGSSEVKRLTGLSTTTIWRLEKAGVFPQRVLLSTNRVGWVRREVEDWLDSRRRYQKGKLTDH